MLYRIVKIATQPTFTRLLFQNNSLALKKMLLQQQQPILSKTLGCIHTSSKQLFASHSQDWQNTPSTEHSLLEKVQQHPRLVQQFVEFTNLLKAKGVDICNQQPSSLQLMKLMKDPEVREKVKLVGQALQESGLQLDMRSIQELQASLSKMQQPPAPPSKAGTYVKESIKDVEDGENSDNSNKGVMNKVKGLFGKK